MNDSLQTYHRWTDGCRPSDINQIRWSMSLQNIGPVGLAKGQHRKNVNSLKKTLSAQSSADCQVEDKHCQMHNGLEG